MGASRAGEFAPASVDLDVAFATENDDLLLTISWAGDALDRQLALLWGDGTNDAVARGGCFGACHADMPGMRRDYGVQVGKYLWAAQAQQREVGQPALYKNDAELAQLVSEGNFAELWRIRLGAEPTFEVGTVLAGIDWMEQSPLGGSASYSDGRWTVTLRRPMAGSAGMISLEPEGKYTVGLSLSGQSNPGGRHWVSLPHTFSLTGNETDFRVD